MPIFLSLFSGLLLGLCFPPFNLSYLAWIALVPLLFINEKRGRFRILLGFLTGLITNLILFWWIWDTFKAAQVNFITTFGAWLSLAALMGLYTALFFLILPWIQNSNWKPWMGAFLWICLDHLRSILFSGFPWGLLGHTQAANLPLIQLTSLTGVSGVTFILVATNIALAEFLKGPFSSRPKIFNLSAILILIFVIHYGGWVRLEKSDQTNLEFLSVALLQGNIDQYQKWDSTYEKNIRLKYQDVIKKSLPSKPQLIVWPESAVPGWYPNDSKYKKWVHDQILGTEAHHLIGAITRKGKKDFNSAFFLNPKGEILGDYQKQHLVPFGEYIPFRGVLEKIIPYFGKLGTFTTGKKPRLFELGPYKFAPNICFEAIFPNLIRQSTRLGADFIVNITNDGWYLDTAAPEQHYIANIFRAVENGKTVVRAANSGISAIIDPWGRQLLRSPLMTSGSFTGDIPIPRPPLLTWHLKWGNWFTTMGWGITLLWGMSFFRRKKSLKNFT